MDRIRSPWGCQPMVVVARGAPLMGIGGVEGMLAVLSPRGITTH